MDHMIITMEYFEGNLLKGATLVMKWQEITVTIASYLTIVSCLNFIKPKLCRYPMNIYIASSI